jgi:hypothetical protein
MLPTPPFWVVQRQVKVEPVDECTVRLQAPNLPAYELALRPVSGAPGWTVVLYRTEGGGERHPVAESDALADQPSAWEAAFELYRQHVVV